MKPGAGEEFTLKTSSILLDYQKKFNKHGELSLRFLSGALVAKNLRGEKLSDSVSIQDKANHESAVLNLFSTFH